uniref:collagen alpha-1(XIV) chain-like n=1 Tax=Styela clava TaxID=7725 RepID=UPI00193AA0F8|nr:collagen alpha-1(XIV) chain-like [Styela clava]
MLQGKLKKYLYICLYIHACHEASKCEQIAEETRCDPLSTPKNGKMYCRNGNEVGSECLFACEPYHSLIGSSRIKCLQTSSGLKWSNSTVVLCKPNRCKPDIDMQVPGKFVTCSRTNKVTSVCHFKCLKPGYTVSPTKTIKCLPNQQWSGKVPCCGRSCSLFTNLDVYIIFESSEYIGVNIWIEMKELIKNAMGRYEISSDSLKISAIRFNKDVDTDNIIRMDDYLNKKSEFWYKFDRLPHDGRGSNTGKAIRYLVNNMMNEESGNRIDVVDIVILLSSGKIDDDVSEASRELRESGAFVIVIASSSSEPWFNEEKLIQIAGNKQNWLIPKGDDFGDMHHLVMTGICGRGC